jgi:hypothetical protein
MQIHTWFDRKRSQRRGVTSAFYLLLLCMLKHSVALTAEQLRVQSPSTSFGPTALDKPAQDITVSGTVEQLVKTHVPSAPTGVQLLVAAPQGAVTATLGPNLSRAVLQSMSKGAAIQISGVMQTIDGHEYLLARNLTIGGNQIIVRNEHGFLTHYPTRSRASLNSSALYRSAK